MLAYLAQDEKATVQQIADFLGYHYSDDIIERIADHTTFKNMKKNPMANPDSLFHETKKTSFMRKGKNACQIIGLKSVL